MWHFPRWYGSPKDEYPFNKQDLQFMSMLLIGSDIN